jgi:diguanylate cyclase
MLLRQFGRSLRVWSATLKFKIMLMAAVIAVLSAGVATQLVLATHRADIQRLLLQQDADDRELTAALLGTKLELLRAALAAVATQVTPDLLQDRAAITRFLVDKPAINALFDTVFTALPNGALLARLHRGVPTEDLPHIADREYFQRVMKTGQAVVSQPIMGRASKAPLVIFAVPIKSSNGEVIGCMGGSLQLRSTSLLFSVSREQSLDRSLDMVIDASGRILAHPDPARLLGKAEDEPGFAQAFAQWASTGRTIHAEGSAGLSQGHMVSMAGIPFAEWMMVRITSESVAMQPVAAAQRTAWRAAAGVGLSAALLAAVLAWFMTQPISNLRSRAERLLSNNSATAIADHEGWPKGAGEVGELARVFKHVMAERQHRQHETQALLRQLEAVLDNAEVGIAFSRNSRFELVSRNFCRVFGHEKSQVTGQATRLIYASDEAYAALGERARPAFMSHGAFDGELELVRRSGETFWAHMRGRAVVPGDTSQGTIWIIEDVTHTREQRERLTWTASHDSLTGLANRAAFEVLLEQATLHAAEHPFCALFIDLDRFKLVNDSAGHAAGDALLRAIAKQFVGQVRHSDTVARLGGDEFAVLLHRCPAPQALAIAEKLRAAVESYALAWEGRSFGVGASIGLVPVDATFASHADVLRAADSACYAAKRGGRNRVASYTPDSATDVDPAVPAISWSV